MTDHITQEAESAMLRETAFERWADKVERLLGHSLDGDQDLDGYSMDLALAAFGEGQSPSEHVSRIKSQIASLAAA